jgi:hypothetical protein
LRAPERPKRQAERFGRTIFATHKGMADRPRPTPLRTGCLLVTASFLVPLLISIGIVAAGVPEVVSTGMCPAAPPDVPAYPCTVRDYLLRMTVGPWALMGHFAVWSAWCGVVVLVGIGLLLVRSIMGLRRGGSSSGANAR